MLINLIMKKVLIIGKRGFIGKNLNKFLKNKYNVKLISFKEALNFKQIDKYNFVINSSINRNYIKKKYNKNFDNDLKIAERINNKKNGQSSGRFFSLLNLLIANSFNIINRVNPGWQTISDSFGVSAIN